jgi:hypothetical protein
VLPSVERADVFLSLDADFLAWGPAMLTNARTFARRREPGNAMNRLYVAESLPSLTGAMADHRCRWHLPDLHALESWGDALVFDGTISIIQPLIQPFYDGISPHVLAAALLNECRPTITISCAAIGAEYWPIATSNASGVGHCTTA